MVKESKEKICFRCHKEIEKNAEYFAFSEYKNDKLIKIDYAHKLCWNLFLEKLGDVSEAKGLIKSLKGWFIKQGVIAPEEITII